MTVKKRLLRYQPNNHGRPKGAINKITRTMKDAAIAAANELGQIDRDKWAEEARKGDPENGMKHFFKVIAVEELRTFAIILARIMPLHVTTGANKLPKYLTEEQMRAELNAAGLPEDLIKFMHPVDVMSVDPDEVGDDPYPDPEADDDEMIDMTPDKEAAE